MDTEKQKLTHPFRESGFGERTPATLFSELRVTVGERLWCYFGEQGAVVG